MAERPDIAMFIPTLESGGAERVVTNLARSFVELDTRVEIVLARGTGPLQGMLDPSIRVLNLNVRGRVQAVPALTRYLRRVRPGALLSHMDIANVAALASHRLAASDARIVVCSHLAFSAQVRGARRVRDLLVARAMRRLYPRADGIVAVSAGVADDLAQVARISRDRISVIHNPIVTDELLADASARVDHPWFADGGPPVILAAGRLTKQKDYPTLLRAFRRAREERELRLVILGEGEERERLDGLRRELGVLGEVDFTGLVANPYAFMARASLFVLSSAWEGFGNVVVEAMACGTPVVSTDCASGPGEILESGRYGRLVPVGDDGALARAMLTTLDDPPRPEVLRERAEDFRADRAASRYLRVLAGNPE
jgi:glycosyltransferase involved in cell wall biosynthesis